MGKPKISKEEKAILRAEDRAWKEMILMAQRKGALIEANNFSSPLKTTT
jgi:hypothetical protein